MICVTKRLLLAVGCFVVLTGCSGDDDNNNPITGSGDPPSISRVSWAQTAGCSAGTSSAVTITVTASDPDGDISNLSYSGSVSSCSGSINSPVSTVTCPQLGQYSGSVTVTDPDGNTDSVSFAFGTCQNGEVTK